MTVYELKQMRQTIAPSQVDEMPQTQIDAIREAVSDAIARAELRDHEARAAGREAILAIQSHERLCLERTRQAEIYRDAMKTKIDRLEQMMWALLCSVTVSLLGMLGTTVWPRLIH